MGVEGVKEIQNAELKICPGGRKENNRKSQKNSSCQVRATDRSPFFLWEGKV